MKLNESTDWKASLLKSGPLLGSKLPRYASLNAAGAACETVHRLFGEEQANPAAYNLLCHELQLLDAASETAGPANLLAFRLKLLLAAGFVPELASCAACGAEVDGRSLSFPLSFAASLGGVTCPECPQAGGFRLDGAALSFMALALGTPLKEAPSAAPAALAQVDRAVTETLEHHAQVRLRSVA